MPGFRFTPYFENEVLRKRPYLSKEMGMAAIERPLCNEVQADGRICFWIKIEDRFLRGVTLEDRVTIHNAFFDRGFTP